MTNKYTQKQAKEIAGFMDYYSSIQETARILETLGTLYTQTPNPETKKLVMEKAFELRVGIGLFREKVPQPIRDNLHGRRLEALETLATNTLLQLE